MKYGPLPTETARNSFTRRIDALIAASRKAQKAIAVDMAEACTDDISSSSLEQQISKFKTGGDLAQKWMNREEDRLRPLAIALGLADAAALHRAYSDALGGDEDEQSWHPAFPGIRVEIGAPLYETTIDKLKERWPTSESAFRGRPPVVWLTGPPESGRTTTAHQLARALSTPEHPVRVIEVGIGAVAPPDQAAVLIVDRAPTQQLGVSDLQVQTAPWGAREVAELAKALRPHLANDDSARLQALEERADEVELLLGSSRRPRQVIHIVADLLRRGLPDPNADRLSWRIDATWRRAVERAGPGTLERLSPEWMASFWLERVQTVGVDDAFSMTEGEAIAALESIARSTWDGGLDRSAVIADLERARVAAKAEREERLERVARWLGTSPSWRRLRLLVDAGLLERRGDRLVATDPELARGWAARAAAQKGTAGLDVPQHVTCAHAPDWAADLGQAGLPARVLLNALADAGPVAAVDAADCVVAFASTGAKVPDEALTEAWATCVLAYLHQTLESRWTHLRNPWRHVTLRSVSRVCRAGLPFLDTEDRRATLERLVSGPVRDLIARWTFEGQEDRDDAGEAIIEWLCPWQCPPREVLRAFSKDPLTTEVLVFHAENGNVRCQAWLAGWSPESPNPMQFQAWGELPVHTRLKWLGVIPKEEIRLASLSTGPYAVEDVGAVADAAITNLSTEKVTRWTSFLVDRFLLPQDVGEVPEALPVEAVLGFELARRTRNLEVLVELVHLPEGMLQRGAWHSRDEGTLTFEMEGFYPVRVGAGFEIDRIPWGDLRQGIESRLLSPFRQAVRAALEAGRVLADLGHEEHLEYLLNAEAWWRPSDALVRSWRVVHAVEALRRCTVEHLLSEGNEPPPWDALADLPEARSAYAFNSEVARRRAWADRLEALGVDARWTRLIRQIDWLAADGGRLVDDRLLSWIEAHPACYFLLLSLGDPLSRLYEQLVPGAAELLAARGNPAVVVRWYSCHPDSMLAYKLERILQRDEGLIRHAWALDDSRPPNPRALRLSHLDPMPGWLRAIGLSEVERTQSLPDWCRRDIALLEHLQHLRPTHADAVFALQSARPGCKAVQDVVRAWLEAIPTEPSTVAPDELTRSQYLHLTLHLAAGDPAPVWLGPALRAALRRCLDVGDRRDWLGGLAALAVTQGLGDEVRHAWAHVEGADDAEAVRFNLLKPWLIVAPREEVVALARTEGRIGSEAYSRLSLEELPTIHNWRPTSLSEAPWGEPTSRNADFWGDVLLYAMREDPAAARRDVEEHLRRVPVAGRPHLAAGFATISDAPPWLRWLTRELYLPVSIPAA